MIKPTIDEYTTDETTILEMQYADMDRLRDQLLDLVARDRGDPLMKPFAALLAARAVCCIAAEGSEMMRLKVASALVVLLREIAPEYVMDLPRNPGQAH